MIKITGSTQEEVKYSVVYNKYARVLDIESSAMSDDCIPFEESTGCMVWLNNNKTLGEIECIFPVEIESIGSLMSQNVKHLKATPQFNVSFEEKPVEVLFNNSQLLLIFNRTKKADSEYTSSNINFYVSDNELIAIVCTDFKLI